MKLFELKLRLIAPLLVFCCFVFFGTRSAHAATCTVITDGLEHSASTPNTVLMLRSTVSLQGGSTITFTGDCGSLEAQQAMASPLNQNVEIDNDATWGAKTQSDFATYSAIVLGDPGCVSGTAPITAAQNNVGVWGPAITGLAAIVGTDPEFHFNANVDPQKTTTAQLTQNAIAYATSVFGKTGAYISLSCYYAGSPAGTAVPVLSPFGSFTVQGTNWNVSTIVASTNPVVTTPNMLNNTGLSNWGNSSHEGFNSFPANFTAVVNTQLTATSTTILPYILAENNTQTKTLGAAGTTTTYTFPTPSGQTYTYKITGTDNAGGESLTITAFPIPQSLCPTFNNVRNKTTGVTGNETGIPYGGYSTPECVQFQATCTTTTGGTTPCNFHYTVFTAFDLPTPTTTINNPDFVVAHDASCPLTSMSTVESIFDAYLADRADPTDVACSLGPSCFEGTHVPGSPATTPFNTYLVGFFPPIGKPPIVNDAEAGAALPILFQANSAAGSITPTTTSPGAPSPGLTYCDPTTTMCGAGTVTIQFFQISCGTLAPPSMTIAAAAAGASGLQFNGATATPPNAWQFNAKPPKSFAGTCQRLEVALPTGSSAPAPKLKADFSFH